MDFVEDEHGLRALRQEEFRIADHLLHDGEIAGGIYVDEPCVVDGNLVSGRTYHDNGRYLGPWIEQLLQRERSTATSDAPPPTTSPRRKPVG